VEDLFRFAFDSSHRGPLMDRKQWFDPLGRPYSVLWWIPEGQIPTVEDMRQKLELLQRRGPTPEAFTFATRFDPEGTPVVQPGRVQIGSSRARSRS
jgi:hypothetical protein